MADTALSAPTFDLEPFRNGKFNFHGNDRIARIDLVGMKLKFPGVAATSLDVTSADVFEGLRRYVPGLSPTSGDLVSVRLRFNFPGRRRRLPHVTFEINPPAKTDLPDTLYAKIVNEYLVEQKVKLK